MTDIRWIALLPDPTSPRWQPMAIQGTPLVWIAENRTAARRLAALDLSPAQFRLAEIVSVLEYETRQRERLPAAPAKWRPPTFQKGGYRRRMG
jgi:hypothetical protein